MHANIGAPGPLTIRDLPQIDVARRGIEPQHITVAVIIVVAEADRLVAKRVRTDISAAVPRAVRQPPDVDVADCHVVPGKVARSIRVEVANAGRRPARRMRTDIDARGPMDGARRFTHIRHGDRDCLIVGESAVRCAHGDEIAVVVVGVRGRFKVRRIDERKRTGRGIDLELALIDPAHQRIGDCRASILVRRNHRRHGC